LQKRKKACRSLFGKPSFSFYVYRHTPSAYRLFRQAMMMVMCSGIDHTFFVLLFVTKI